MKLLSTTFFALSVILSPIAAQAEAPTKNVVEIAAGNTDFSTLVAAVKAAGLAETLSGKGPFTVFAPTNAAFAKLPAGSAIIGNCTFLIASDSSCHALCT